MDIRKCDDCGEYLYNLTGSDNYWWCQKCGSLYNMGIVPMSRKTESKAVMELKDMLDEYNYNDSPNFKGHLEIFFGLTKRR